MAKVSVIVNVYNVEKYLKECLDSIKNQTLRDIEIICIDDGSTDSSLKILNDFAKEDNRFVVLSQKHSGIGITRNKGINIANGEYIGFVDGSDFIENNMYEELYNLGIQNHSDIVECKVCEVDEEGCIAKCWRPKPEPEDGETFNYKKCLIFKKNSVEHCNKIFKLDFIRKNNIKNYEASFCENFYFTTFAKLLAEKITYKKSWFYYRRIRKNSMTHYGKKECCVLSDILKSLENFIKKYPEIKEGFYIECLDEFKLCDKITDKKYKNEFLKECRKNISDKNYDELQKKIKKENKKKNILEELFALTNIKGYFYKTKIVKILGIRSDLFFNNNLSILKFKKHKIKPKTVLIVEGSNSHSETILGYAKYFKELGYNIDFMLFEHLKHEKPFTRADKVFRKNLYYFKLNEMNKVLQSENMKNYDFVLANSNYLYLEGSKMEFDQFFRNKVMPKYGYLYVEHHLDEINDKNLSENRIIKLANINTGEKTPVFVNPNYFGKVRHTEKNKVVNFITIGKTDYICRNHDMLIQCVEKLNEMGIENYTVTVIGQNNWIDYPKSVLNKLRILGRISFDKMFHELERADFFLPLLDNQNKEHERYIKHGTSGSFQLIYGFRKPCIISEKFGKPHYFNSDNSIIYKDNDDFVDAMIKAINIKDEDYNKLCINLDKTTENIRKISLNNLKDLLDYHIKKQEDNK